MRPTPFLRSGVRATVMLALGLVATGGDVGRPSRAWAEAPVDAPRRIPADLRPAVDAAVARGAAWLATKAGADGLFRWSVDGQRSFSHWNARACDEGEGESAAGGCYYLGLNLEAGRGGPADPAEVAARFARACEQGWSEACR